MHRGLPRGASFRHNFLLDYKRLFCKNPYNWIQEREFFSKLNPAKIMDFYQEAPMADEAKRR